MQIQKINNTPFQAKQRALNNGQLYRMKMLLTRMNEETCIKKEGNALSSTVVSALNSKDSRLVDTRLFFHKVKPEEQMTRNSMLIMGNTQLVIDNSTGKISDWNKPFFSCWNSIMKKVDKSINFLYENFYNTESVQKEKITLHGYSLRGFEELKPAKEKING